MTSVVAILNTQAVAIAADSAVSVNNKIYNNALKIFTLSKYHPVGIMIYGNANFLNTPWETIIKLYRKDVGDRDFDTVAAYQVDFIEYLHSKKFFSDPEFVREYGFNFTHVMVEDLFKNCLEFWDKQPATGVDLLNRGCINLSQWWAKEKKCKEFEDYTNDNFLEDFGPAVSGSIDSMQIAYRFIVPPETRSLINDLLYIFIKCQETVFHNSGLVFVGYGREQIFPSVNPINISFPIGSRLRYFENTAQTNEITNRLNSVIAPFAQTETIDTILRGIAPKLQSTYDANIRNLLASYKDRILNVIDPGSVDLIHTINNIDSEALFEAYQGGVRQTIQEIYMNPLHEAVSSLGKEALAEMAESLIYLTFMQKRITFAQENVGGTVDVAIISKGDGFIWIKRKHYFEPELNAHFFKNYFKK